MLFANPRPMKRLIPQTQLYDYKRGSTRPERTKKLKTSTEIMRNFEKIQGLIMEELFMHYIASHELDLVARVHM